MRPAGDAALGAAVKGMQRGEGAGGRELEDGAAPGGAAAAGRAVEVAIAGLDEAGRGAAALGAAVEGMQRGEGAGGRELEDGAAQPRAAAAGRAVEVAIAGLDEAGVGTQPSVLQSKACSVVRVPAAVILKTVPPPAVAATERSCRRSCHRWPG